MKEKFVLRGQTEESLAGNGRVDSHWMGIWRRFIKKKKALAGLAAILLIFLLAVFAPILSPYQYDEIISTEADGRTVIADGISPCFSLDSSSVKGEYFAGKRFLFGTDELGRDLWSRTWRGARVSLLIAFTALVINMFIGMVYGMVSGYAGGNIDAVMQHITEIINSIPTLVIIAVLAIFIPKGIGLVIVSLIITGWIGMNRIVRAQVLKIKEMEYVMASKTLGTSYFGILFNTILPNMIGQIITQVMFSLPTAIFTEAFLSFVGVGIRLPDCSIGSLIEVGFENIAALPYQVVPPLVVLVVLMLAFQLIGDSLKESFNPGVGEV